MSKKIQAQLAPMLEIAELLPGQIESAGIQRIQLPGENDSSHAFHDDFERAKFESFAIEELYNNQVYAGARNETGRFVRPALHRTLAGLTTLAAMSRTERRFEGRSTLKHMGLYVLHASAVFPNDWHNNNPQSIYGKQTRRSLVERQRFYATYPQAVAEILRASVFVANGDVIQIASEAQDFLTRLRVDAAMPLPEVREDDREVVVSMFDRLHGGL